MKYFTLLELFLLILLIIIILLIISNLNLTGEGFNNKERIFERRGGNNVFDTAYVDIYDSLFYNNIKNEYEVEQIINSNQPKIHSKLLDIGCGTGHHVEMFNKNNLDSIGIDFSPAMIEQAQLNYPKNKYRVCDALNSIEFPPDSFTHITCLYFTIYYIKNKKLFFSNCFDWLVSDGTLILHLVNAKKFDPITPASYSQKNHNSNKQIKGTVKFDVLDYKSNFILDENINSNVSTLKNPNAIFKETLKFKDSNKTRVNEHKLFMASQKSILALAKDAGFILKAQKEMTDIEYNYNYLYYLVKP